MSLLGGYPSGMRDDPEDYNSDHLGDLEIMLARRIEKSADLPPHRGVKLKSLDICATDVFTAPPCDRKSVLLSLSVEVQVDGNDLEQNVFEVCDEVGGIFNRIL
jgi:hypothetical protein